MRPFLVTATGIALGLAVVLPVAQGQVVSTAGPAGVAAAPGVLRPSPAIGPPHRARAAPASGGPPTAGAPAAGPVPVNGTSVTTRYGPVQVQAVLSGGTISSVAALTLPGRDGKSRQISGAAGPQLGAEAVRAQSAQLDTVSGASYTSDGYRRSLQAALDIARTQGLTGPATAAPRSVP